MNKKKKINQVRLWTVICVVVVLLVLSTALVYRDFFGFGSYIDNTENPSDNTFTGDAISDLLAAPEDGSDSASESEISEIITVTEENLRTIIKNISPYDVYSWDFTVTTHSTVGALEETNSLIFEADTYELTVTVGDAIQRIITDDGENVTVSEYSPLLSTNSFPSDLTDVFSCARLATPESFLSLPEDMVDFSCTLSKGIYGNIANLEFSYEIVSAPGGADTEETRFVYRESYKISLDYGLVISARTYENDVLVYELETTNLKNSLPSESDEQSSEDSAIQSQATQTMQ